MNKYQSALPILALAIVMTFMSACSSDLDQADTIIYRGTVVTVDDSNPSAEASAIKDGRIVAVGYEPRVMAWRGDDTEVINIAGQTVVPGFIDGHSHFVNFGAQAVGANLLAPPDGQVENIADLVNALKGFGNGPDVDRTGWIFGLGYDDAVLAEGRHPTADDLDKVSTEIPVMAVHISGHFSAVNNVALEKIGYSSETPDPEGGIIRRRPGTLEPNGVLEELAGIPITISVVTPTTEENQVYFLQKSQEIAMRFGYTTAQEGRAFAGTHDQLVKFAEKGLLEIDIVSYIDYAYKELIDSDWHSRDYRNRTSRSGQVMGPDERLTPLEALKAIILWGAYSHFEEDHKGSIEVGKLADLVILSANPLTVDPMNIGEIKVLATIKEGNTVFRTD